mmetsp:Transcript_50127/g.92529  ORF Transcript_50127/g.92529 Transcript_50127/m.92529 type:complete len:242 (-) Transcript_50127:80-805(-)
MLLQRIGNHLSSLCFALRADDCGLSLLLRSCNHKLLPLGLLLCYLLLFDGLGKFLAIHEMGDGNVIHQDVELSGSLCDCFPDFLGHLLSLSQQLLSIVLSNGCFQHLVGNGWQDALIIVFTQGLVYVWQPLHIRTEEHSAMDGDGLKILGSCCGLNELRANPNIVQLGSHHPRDLEVSAFTSDLVLNSCEHVQDHCALASIHIEQARSRNGGQSCNPETRSGNHGQDSISSCHCCLPISGL